MSRAAVGPNFANGDTPSSPSLFHPSEVAEQLGVAPATLRVWSNQFGDWLSPEAQPRRDGGARLHRRYSADDVALLARVNAWLNQGLTYEQARRQLADDATSEARPIPLSGPRVDLVTGLSALRERLPHLPRKQYQLAQALLNTPEMIMFGSVRELAMQLDVNNATIIRFAQSLGYSGYQALQSALRQAYLPRAGLQPPRDLASRHSPDSALAATLAQHKANLRLARAHLLAANLDDISDVLLNAQRILVTASGSSIVPATLLVRLLRHVGLRGELVPPAAVDREIALYDTGPGDVVIGIGFWLTFKGVAEVLALGRRLGATTIAITGSPTSPLTRAADHLLIAPAQGAAFSFSAVATVAVVEALMAHLAGRRPERTAEIEQRLHDLYLKGDLLAPLLAPNDK